MNEYCVVVTGLPASGKSTAGRAIADLLAVPFIDKDAFLEDLFRKRGIGGPGWRQRLSRESDRLFIDRAKREPRSVLVSHWRPVNHDATSGTPTEWLDQTFNQVVELYCACPVDVASRRFKRRQRHPGHLDGSRTLDETVSWMRQYAQHLPMMLGTLIEVDTTIAPDNVETAGLLKTALGLDAYDTGRSTVS